MVDVRQNHPVFAVGVNTIGQGAIALTDDVVSITTNKTLHNASGNFTIVIKEFSANKKDAFGRRLKWEDVLNPMDYLELGFGRKRVSTVTAPVIGDDADTSVPPIMRGFIDSVSPIEIVNQENPNAQQRALQITGRDYGKLAETFQIWYRNNISQVVSNKGFSEYRNALHDEKGIPPIAQKNQVAEAVGTKANFNVMFSSKFGMGDIRADWHPDELMRLIVDGTVVDMQRNFLKRDKAFPRDLSLAFATDRQSVMKADLRISGSSFQTMQGSAWNVMQHNQNAPFNELFFMDTPDGPELIFRPTPWRDEKGILFPEQSPQGEFLSFSDPEKFRTEEREVEMFGSPVKSSFSTIIEGGFLSQDLVLTKEDTRKRTVGRTDAELLNYFFTTIHMQALTQGQFLNTAIAQSNNNPHMDVPSMMTYGFKPLEVHMTAFVTAMIQGSKEERQAETSSLQNLIASFNLLLVNAFKDNPRFEAGVIPIKGREDAHIGKYLIIEDEKIGGVPVHFYIEGVSHTFVPFRSWDTSLAVTRGNRFLLTRSIDRGPDQELGKSDLVNPGGIGTALA